MALFLLGETNEQDATTDQQEWTQMEMKNRSVLISVRRWCSNTVFANDLKGYGSLCLAFRGQY